jgi:hypothetical protein
MNAALLQLKTLLAFWRAAITTIHAAEPTAEPAERSGASQGAYDVPNFQ